MAMLAFVFVSCTIDPNGESTPGTNTDPEDWRNSEYYRYYVGANSSQHNASRSNIANIMPVFNTQEAVAGGAPAINPHVVAGLLKVLDEVPQQHLGQKPTPQIGSIANISDIMSVQAVARSITRLDQILQI